MEERQLEMLAWGAVRKIEHERHWVKKAKGKVCRHQASEIAYSQTAVDDHSRTWVHAINSCGGVIPREVVGKLDHAEFLDP